MPRSIPALAGLAAALLAALTAAEEDGETPSGPIHIPAPEARRLEVLFLGSENRFGHDPPARFRVIRQALGPRGINFTWAESTEALTPENLARFDALLLFANIDTISAPQQEAMLEFARGGGGCVFLHCASACFRESNFDEFPRLVGARFDSHESGVFRAEIVKPDHPVMDGWDGFECWDETYVHKQHADGRTILQQRDGEPWTWVHSFGDGRVFYTASGHDHRCWDLPAYHELVFRAVKWVCGEEATALLERLDIPELKYRPAAVPKDPDNPVGPNNDLQLPLPPRESLKLAQIPPGFALRVFASEPDIINPIAINWDDRGRLWVVEAFDYPHKIESDDPQDRIKILADTDGDGAADSITVFADGLNICTSVLPMPDGAIATDGHDMVYLVDDDGDDRADSRRVIFSGISLRDTHACVSSLRFGFDHWIYATVGYSGIDVSLGNQRHVSEMGVFRFRPDGSALEILQNTTNNTWGLGFTDEGDVVGSTANGNPSWYLSIPNRFFAAAGLDSEKTPRADDEPLLFPITRDYFQNWPKEHVSSGAGHAVATGSRLPADWINRRVFICEPPLHLVAAPRMTEAGAGFETRGFEDVVYASADAWSAPVAAEVGPDGATWIADWYNPICNHNPYRDHQKRGAGNAFVTDDRDRTHGRIYRVFPVGSPEPPRPDIRNIEASFAALDHPNRFWRVAAQRRLATEPAAADHLAAAARENTPLASLHALRALEALRGRDDADLQALAASLTRSPHRGVAASAFQILHPAPDNLPSALELLQDPSAHPRARLAAALFLAEAPPDPALGATAADLLATPMGDDDIAAALRLVALRHPEGALRRALESGSAPDSDAPASKMLSQILARLRQEKSLVSPGLLAAAAQSELPIAREILAAADAPAAPPAAPAAPLSESAARGREIYIACVACHQPDGGGLANTFPPLAGSPRATGDPETLVRIVLKGMQGPFPMDDGRVVHGVMPGHESSLDDREIADVLTFIRSAWGNGAAAVSPSLVRDVRAATADRAAPWTPAELGIIAP